MTGARARRNKSKARAKNAAFFPDLPADVWEKISSDLEPDDKKHFRMSCRRFYDALNTFLVLRKEQLVFYGNIDTEEAFRSFTSSNRCLWNFKLYGVHLVGSIRSFFIEQGHCVRSLTLHNCEMARGVLKSIVEHCEILTFLDLKCDRHICKNVFDDFQSLENDGIVRSNVTSFTLTMKFKPGKRYLTNGKFFRFFTIFPNIRQLEIEVSVDQRFSKFSTDDTDITADKVFSFDCVLYQVTRMRHQLQKLCLHFLPTEKCSLPFQTFNEISQIELSNLRELSLTLLHIWDANVQNPLLQFKHLTDLNCILSENVLREEKTGETDELSSRIKLLLSTYTELRSLSITSSRGFEIQQDCFEALVRSQLVNLTINIDFDRDSYYSYYYSDAIRLKFEPSSLDDQLFPNFVLKNLHFSPMGNSYNSVLMLFVSYFRTLNKLVVQKVKPDILQKIFDYQIELHNLTLCYNYKYSSDWYDGVKRALSAASALRLDCITHLYIKEEKSLELSEFLMRNLVAPKLQSLLIEYCISYNKMKHCTYSIFSDIGKLMKLEYLEIRWEIDVTFQQWVDLCMCLPKLRYLLICNTNHRSFEDAEYRLLFKICPSLCAVIHNNFHFTSVKYFKDINTDTIISVPWSESGSKFIYEGIPPKYYDKDWLESKYGE